MSAMPNRSARCTRIVLARGMSRPLSTSVVHSSTSIPPVSKSRMTRASAAAGIWPCATAIRASGTSRSSRCRMSPMVTTRL